MSWLASLTWNLRFIAELEEIARLRGNRYEQRDEDVGGPERNSRRIDHGAAGDDRRERSAHRARPGFLRADRRPQQRPAKRAAAIERGDIRRPHHGEQPQHGNKPDLDRRAAAQRARARPLHKARRTRSSRGGWSCPWRARARRPPPARQSASRSARCRAAPRRCRAPHLRWQAPARAGGRPRGSPIPSRWPRQPRPRTRGTASRRSR